MRLLVYVISFFILSFSLAGQTIQKPLLEANSFFFRHKLFIYGYATNKQELLFKCYSYNLQLSLTDSIELSLGKHSVNDYLELSTDTLHEHINFYFQLANDKNKVSLLRLNEALHQIAFTENYDANHVNSFTVFDNETYRFKNDLFVVRTNTDSAGTQFYLNKYQVKSITKPFEYSPHWQYAFERNYIHRAHAVYADSSRVFVYAHVNDGPKKGQWILLIDAIKGHLINASRLGSKLANKHYLCSNAFYNKPSKQLYIVGSTYDFDALDFKKKTVNFINHSKRHQLFLIGIDSLGETFVKAERTVGLPIQTNFGLFTNSYHLKITNIQLLEDKSFSLWTDLYEQTKPNTFAYNTSWHFDIIPNEIDYDVKPSKMTIATKVIPKLISSNDADPYGKFMLPSITDFDKMMYLQAPYPVLIHSELDEAYNPLYVLKKTDITQGTKQFYLVQTGKKGLEQKQLLSSIKNQIVNYYFIKAKTYLSFISTNNQTSFELKLNTL